MELFVTILMVYLFIGAYLGVAAVIEDSRDMLSTFFVVLFLWPLVIRKLIKWS